MARLNLIKLALKRDNSVPMGQPAPLHLDCPCGQQVKIADVGEVFPCTCGQRYDRAGWMLHAEETSEHTLDAKADRIVDIALAAVDIRLPREERDRLREAMQDAVDALVDECRAYYKELYNAVVHP